MTTFTKKITFTNVKIAYGGCDCCGDDTVYHFEPGPYVIYVQPSNESVQTHAKVAFGANVVNFDYTVEE
jgi:hypothetical protein